MGYTWSQMTAPKNNPIIVIATRKVATIPMIRITIAFSHAEIGGDCREPIGRYVDQEPTRETTKCPEGYEITNYQLLSKD